MTTQSQSKLPYLIGLSLVVVVIGVAAWQLLKTEKPAMTNERQVIELPNPVVEQAPIPEEPSVEEQQNEPEQSLEVIVPSSELKAPVEPVVTRQLPSLDDSDAVVKEALADSLSVNMLKLS